MPLVSVLFVGVYFGVLTPLALCQGQYVFEGLPSGNHVIKPTRDYNQPTRSKFENQVETISLRQGDSKEMNLYIKRTFMGWYGYSIVDSNGNGEYDNVGDQHLTGDDFRVVLKDANGQSQYEWYQEGSLPNFYLFNLAAGTYKVELQELNYTSYKHTLLLNTAPYTKLGTSLVATLNTTNNPDDYIDYNIFVYDIVE